MRILFWWSMEKFHIFAPKNLKTKLLGQKSGGSSKISQIIAVQSRVAYNECLPEVLDLIACDFELLIFSHTNESFQ